MKTISLIFTVVLVSLATSVVCDEHEDNEKTCIKQINVTEDELKAFYNGGLKPADAKGNVKCFIKCMMESEGILRNGVFSEEAAIKSLRQLPSMKDFPNLEKVVSECKDEKGPTECDTAYMIFMCLLKNNVKLD